MLHPQSGFLIGAAPPMTTPGSDSHCRNAFCELPFEEAMVARPFVSLTRPSLVMITRVGILHSDSGGG